MAQLTTFVFTDLVGSVSLKGRMPGPDAASRDAAYVERVLQPHRERIEAGLADAEGRVVSTAGDGHFLVFPDTARAALWAMGVIRSHQEQPIAVDGASAEVRIGMHAGTPQPDPADPDNFVGRAVDYAARLSDHAQGGQILVSRTTASLIEDGGLDGVRLHAHGTLDLKGIGDVALYELLAAGRQPSEPRRNSTGDRRREWSVLPRTMGLTEYVAQSGGESGQKSKPKEASTSNSATAVRPRRVGNYELQGLLGAGGMGNVYKARHAQFERARAVKIIRPDLVESGGDSVVHRFYQEVRATGSLEHPNLVVAIDSSSPDDEEHYLVMEYIDGVSLDELLRQDGPLPIADACEIARQAALGLVHLHEEGLVHRDVKPSNLMLTLANSPHAIDVARSGSIEQGSVNFAARSTTAKLPVVKLMDLGLALLVRGDEERLTQMDRGGMGTGHYMSPEQWRTTSVDIRADIYSLGCTLHHLLMGEPPFARSDLKPERSHATEAPPPLTPACGAPKELTELVARMLAKRPEDRPQTPLEVVEVLTPLAIGHRLGERVTGYRKGDSSTRRSDLAARLETLSERAQPAETNVLNARPTLTSGGSTLSGVQRSSWWIAGIATLVACAAILALGYARSAMIERHRQSLQTTARYAARGVANAIEKRVSTLESLADNRELLDSLAGATEGGDTKPLQNWLVRNRDKYDDRNNFRSSSWFITDARGNQLARSPASPTIGQNYAHRDYFHGEGRDLPENPDPPPAPITEARQSTVYASGSTGELKVAFSVPIYQQREVVGILAMSVKLGEFAEFNENDADAGDVEILLADLGTDYIDKGNAKSGLILHHRDLKRYAAKGNAIRLPDELYRSVQSQIESDSDSTLEPYQDVFRRDLGPFWGIAAPVIPGNLDAKQRGNWVVISQEPQP